jgi:AraC-like DNA-binding protein
MLSPLHNLTPYIRVAMNQQIPTGMDLRERVIFDHYLACIAEGKLFATVSGKPLELERGEFIFIAPHERHILQCYPSIPTRLPHLHFDFFTLPDAGEVFVSFKPPEELREYNALFRKPIRDQIPELKFSTVIKPLHYEQPLEYLMKIISLQGQSSPSAVLEQRGYLFRLLSCLLHASISHEVLQNPRHLRAMEDAMEIIRRNFAKPLTLEDLARAVHLSPSHFSHMFKQFYQSSPMHFLRNYRIEQVKRLLLTSDKSLTQIAKPCGFSSIHVLSRAFKEVTGQSPSDFLQGFPHSLPGRSEV